MVAAISSDRVKKFDKLGVSNTVHYATIASIVPALALCITHGAITGSLAPALGLIPAGFGAILAVYRSKLLHFKRSKERDYQILLSNERDEGQQLSEPLERFLLALADLMLLAGLSTVLAFSFGGVERCGYIGWWDWEYKRNRQQWQCHVIGQPRLGAYATIPLFFNAVIHAYLILNFLHFAALRVCTRQRKQRRDNLCSRCQIPIREGGRHVPVEEPDTPSMESIA